MNALKDEVAAADAKLWADYKAAVRTARTKGLSAEKVLAVCTPLGLTPDVFRIDVERLDKRYRAVDDIAKAKEAEAEYEAVAATLAESNDEIEAAVKHVEKLRLDRLSVLAKSTQLTRKIHELRSVAVGTLQQTCGDGLAWDDPANMRFGNPPPAAKVLSQETTHAFRPGNTAVLPSSQFIPANRG